VQLLRKCGAIGLMSFQAWVQGELLASCCDIDAALTAALVAPVMACCAEVWGPAVLPCSGTPLACMDNDLHKHRASACISRVED